jgi:hypothetical protein
MHQLIFEKLKSKFSFQKVHNVFSTRKKLLSIPKPLFLQKENSPNFVFCLKKGGEGGWPTRASTGR